VLTDVLPSMQSYNVSTMGPKLRPSIRSPFH
jgi:hypothetical protein